MIYKFKDLGLTTTLQLKNYEKLNLYLTKNLKRKYTTEKLIEVLESNGYQIKKCKICNRPINFQIIFDENIKIIGVEHLTRYSNYQYCYAFYNDCPGRTLNPNSAEFISKVLDITESEALDYIKKNNKSPFYKENHKTKDSYAKYQSRNKNFFIKRYGKKEGLKRWQLSIDKANYSRSLDGFIEKYGKINGTIKWNEYQRKKDTVSRKNFKTEEEYLARIAQLKLTFENFVRKYGEEKGKIKWDEYNKNRSNCYSKWSISLIEKVIETNWFKSLDVEKMYYATLNHEIVICNESNKKCYMYDFGIHFKSGKKIIIEFNGNKFHPNENLSLNERNNWYHPFSKRNFDECMVKEIDKKNRAINRGYDIFYVWDNQTDEENLEIIKNKLYELLK